MVTLTTYGCQQQSLSETPLTEHLRLEKERPYDKTLISSSSSSSSSFEESLLELFPLTKRFQIMSRV